MGRLETIGGNIALCKRGLKACNEAKEVLYASKDSDCLPHNRRMELSELLLETANAVALRVIELRQDYVNRLSELS